MRKFRQGGIPADKIGIGLPFFGYQWTGGGVSGPRQTWSTLPAIQAVPYQSFASQLNSTNVVRDSAASVPYLTNNSSTPSYLTFDDATSIAAKVNYAKTQGLGGWIIWTLGGDYLPTSSDRTPLLSAVRSALGATATAPSITSASSLPPATSGTAYTYTLTSSGTSPISWRVTGGALPTGLTLNASTGAISGVPTTTGTFSFTAEASNTVGTNSRQFSLTVNAATQSVPPSITILTPYSGTVRKVTEITVQVSQSVTSVVYRVDGQPFATVTKAPFSYVGEIPNSGNNGTHFLDAVASDAAGRTATSQRVSIRIR